MKPPLENINELIRVGQRLESLSGRRGVIAELVYNEFYGGETALVAVLAEMDDQPPIPRSQYRLGQFYFEDEKGVLHLSRSRGFEHRFEMWYKEMEKEAAKHGVTPEQMVSIVFSHEAKELMGWQEIQEFKDALET